MSQTPPFVGSIAIVRRGHERDAQWLTVWDDGTSSYRFVEARRGADQSFRTCLIEPIEDELDFNSRDYLLSQYSLAHHQAPIEWPGELVPAWVVIEFFPVHLYGKQAVRKIDELEHVRWWSMHELFKGSATSGEPLCVRQHLLMLRADILPAWATT